MATASPSRLPDPVELIFSCTVCGATLDELYGQPQNERGFNGSGISLDRPATKLWLAECTHLTCNEHLEGGGQ